VRKKRNRQATQSASISADHHYPDVKAPVSPESNGDWETDKNRSCKPMRLEAPEAIPVGTGVGPQIVGVTAVAPQNEVLGLRWRDVDLVAGRAAIMQTIIAPRYVTQLSAPKTEKGRRSVELDAGTVEALRSHRKRQAEERLAFGPGYEDNDLVFRREDGTALKPQLFSLAFETRAKRAGLPRIRLHDLRHTHATLALKAGEPAKVVSERLGHSSVAITLDIYSHADPGLQKGLADRLAALVDLNMSSPQ
jgi:hypothetical protein